MIFFLITCSRKLTYCSLRKLFSSILDNSSEILKKNHSMVLLYFWFNSRDEISNTSDGLSLAILARNDKIILYPKSESSLFSSLGIMNISFKTLYQLGCGPLLKNWIINVCLSFASLNNLKRNLPSSIVGLSQEAILASSAVLICILIDPLLGLNPISLSRQLSKNNLINSSKSLFCEFRRRNPSMCLRTGLINKLWLYSNIKSIIDLSSLITFQAEK